MAEGRISEEDINKVREATDLVALMGERSPVRQKGRDFWCCCPIHNEKTPSCKIDPALQLWHCFGCGEGGDAFGFLMKADGMSFPEAVQTLADRAHIEIERTGEDKGTSNSQKARLKAVCAESCAFFHQQLMRGRSAQAAEARKYLSGRQLGGTIPKTWQLGFAPGSGTLVKHLRSKGFTPEEMVQANVALQGDRGQLRDRFYNRVMFPIFDVSGECIAFGGRVIGKGEPKYLNSQETPLFHKSTVLFGLDKAKATMATTGVAIVCEGYTDVIALHTAGVTNAVATLGTALTRQHIRILSRHAKNKIIYLFDGDEAGQRAADRALQFIDSSITPEAGRTQIGLYAVTLPDNLDPADFVAQRGGAALQEYLQRAKPLIEYGIMRRIEKHDLGTPEGRVAAFSNALSVLAPIKDSLLAKDYAVQIAGLTQTREEDAYRALAALKVAQRPDEEAPAQPEQPVGTTFSPQLPVQELSRRKFEREMLIMCAQNPACALGRADTLAATHWHEHLHEILAGSILDTLAANSSAKPGEIITAATQAAPSAGAILTGTFNDFAGTNATPAQILGYLAEELSLGDMEESIDAMRAQLKAPALMAEDEYELVFETVVALQKELTQRRAAHVMPV